jgi:hypothetical protein
LLTARQEKHTGTLLVGAQAGLASRLDAVETELEQTAEAESQ